MLSFVGFFPSRRHCLDLFWEIYIEIDIEISVLGLPFYRATIFDGIWDGPFCLAFCGKLFGTGRIWYRGGCLLYRGYRYWSTEIRVGVFEEGVLICLRSPECG